jgi:hypothetical protein
MILAAIGAVAAILFQQLIDRPYRYSGPPLEMWRVAVSIAIGTGAMAFGFGMERVRLAWAAGFALLAGAVAGLIHYWNGGTAGWADIGDWRYASLFLSIAIAVPLFQTARDEGAWRFPYRDVHDHAWTNVLLWFACSGFVGIVFALAWLLAALFDLIGLHFVREMLERDWFAAGLAGAAFGGALGLFRERDRIVRLLQRVVTAVLAVLAPVLGVGLVLFLVALPFTGLGALWQATKATTPILLSCAIGALILANAVIGNGEEEEATNPVLRWGAMALGLAILPLCVIAAIATGLRIDQYGFTPDRLWALIFVILATAYGVAYLASLALGRNAWAARVRPTNLRMAFIIAGVALFLATPILSFNAISTADQVARLESGKIAPDRFDWRALENDYGMAGRGELKRLKRSKNSEIQRIARAIPDFTYRDKLREARAEMAARKDFAANIRVLPQGAVFPVELRNALLESRRARPCSPDNPCTLVMSGDGREGFLMEDNCLGKAAEARDAYGHAFKASLPSACLNAQHFVLSASRWVPAESSAAIATESERVAALSGYRAGRIDIRPVRRRQIFVNGLPVGQPFE